MEVLHKLDEFRVTTDPDTHGRYTGNTDLGFDPSLSTDVLQLDVGPIPSPAKYTPVYYTVLVAAFDWATAVDRDVILYVDEAHHLLKSFETKEPLNQMLQDARHQHVSMQLAFHNTVELTESDHFKTIWGLCAHKLMYRDENIDSVPSNAVDMETAHKEYVSQAKPGSQRVGYSDAVLQLPNMDWQPLRVHTVTDNQDKLI